MEAVTKVFRAGDIETSALNKITLSIKTGEFVAITGPSGSGKTTLLNVAGMLETFDRGTYKLDGEDVSKLGDRQSSRIRNEKIGFVFQSYNLIPDLSVLANIEAPLRYRGFSAAERRKRVDSALAKVGLSTRAKHLPTQLSGGQQQRVAIARAIAGSPKVIFADEPTGNLDSEMSTEIMNLLGEINREGCTIVMVTHNEAQVARAARNVHLLDGRIADRPHLAAVA
jgi:putative ABC transport system ATP-binding protein